MLASGPALSLTVVLPSSGFQCISYPLSTPTSRGLEPEAAQESAGADSPLLEGDQGSTPSGLAGEWSA